MASEINKENKNTTLVDKIQQAKGCKRNSCRVYASNLRRIHKEASKQPWNFNLKWLENGASSILKYIMGLQNVNTARNLMSSAIIGFYVLKDEKNIAKFNLELKKLNVKKAEMQKSGEMTTRQKEVFIPWPRIIALRKLLFKEVRLAGLYKHKKVTISDFKKVQRALVLGLYTLLPPVRLDVADLEFISGKEFEKATDKTSKNYLVMSRGGWKIYWNHTKTSKSMGEIVVLIKKYSPQLQRLLVKHVKYLKKHWPDNRNLLLNSNLSGAKMTRNALTRFLQRMFQQYFRKRISASALRMIFLSHKYDKSKLEEQQEVHRAMHHSGSTALKDYIKKK